MLKRKLLLTSYVWVTLISHCLTQVTVDFSASVTRSCVSTQVVFTNLSTSTAGSIVDLEWDLAGIYANKQSPSIIFTDPGGYDICLIASDEFGNSDTLCREDYVIIWEKPKANFVSDFASGCSPLDVVFTNTSTSNNGEILEATWDVGGSMNLAILENVDSMLHSQYIAPGLYSASLFIADDKGCSATMVKSKAVEVLQNPVFDYSFEVISGCELPWEVKFSNNSPDSRTTYEWDFGNGETFTGTNPPLIVYDTINNFDLIVAIDKNGCIDTIREKDIISPGSTPNFSVSPPGACIDTELTFFETMPISADSIFWDFGDGSISTDIRPLHMYSVSGCYEVTMIRYSGECIDTVTKPCLKINPSPILSAHVENQYACSIPIELGLTASASEPGSFSWDITGIGDNKVLFGDTTSILINQNGSYNISLDYITDNGCTASFDDFPIVIEPFEAILSTENTEGCSPLKVLLQDDITSNLGVVSWEWTVYSGKIGLTGELMTFNEENPTFMISDTGRYDVQLIAENAIGCKDTVLIQEHIKSGVPPNVDFTATPLEDCILTPKNFTSVTSDFADAWVWGTDGTDTLSIEQNPSIILPSVKTWDISLTAYHNGCSNTIIKEDYINILEPGVNYKIEYNCDDPYTVMLNNGTTGADSSFWEIDLGSGDRDTFFNSNLERYTFPDRGRYFINHYAINYESGCEHYRSDTIIVTDPKAVMTLDTIKGCAPLTIKINGDSQDDIYIEYLIPGATIDSTLSVTDPSITYIESGLFLGPTLIITDFHGCKDTLTIVDSVQVNKATAIPGFDDGVCVPDSTQIVDQSIDRLGEIVERRWYFDNGTIYSEEESLYVQIAENKFYDVSLAVKDNWGCRDSIYIAQSIYGSRLDTRFTASDTTPCIDYSISFSLDKPNQGLVSHIWDFGDGSTSTDVSPTHTYSKEGLYTVCVLINDIHSCPKTICKENYIKVANPIASFSGHPLFETCPPLITNFTNASINAINYKWDFGDNSGLSNVENPSHIYNEPGTFNVSLIAFNAPYCADTMTIEDYIFVDGPNGTFEFETDSACLPLTITLIAAADDLCIFEWDFGNGETSISETLKKTDTLNYIYENAGTFLPKLILSDDNGCVRSFTTDSIGVNTLLLDFVSDIDTTCTVPVEVNLENLSNSSDPSIRYHWEIYGNEDFEFESEDALFSIIEPGAYSVRLSAKGANCIDSITLGTDLQIGTSPIVDFEVISDQACEDVTAIFENKTTNIYGVIVDYEWDYGDGTISNQIDGSNLYTEVENTNVTLTATTQFGCSDIHSELLLILPNAVPTLPEDYSMCIGDSVQINGILVGSGVSDMILTWNEPNDLSCIDCLQPFASPVDTTEYIITAQHSNGCMTMDTMTINVVPVIGPALSLSVDTVVCAGDTALVAINNFDNALTYVWEDSPTLGCFDCEFVSAYPQDDTYYTVTVFNQYGCFKADSLLVEVEQDIPDFLTDDRGICEDSQTLIIVSNDVLNPSWQNDSSLSCLNCYETTATPDANQFYYLGVNSAVGCEYRDSVFITVIPADTITISDDGQICEGEQMILASSGAGDPIWSPATNLSSQVEPIIFGSPQESTMYTVTYTYDECIQSDSILIDVIYKADITAIGDTICEDESAELIATGMVDRFAWLDETGMVISTGDTLIYDTEIDQTILVVGKLGLCEEDSILVSVVVQPTIDVTLGTTEYELFINSAEIVDIDFDETYDYSYSWSPANGLSCDDCPEPKISNIGQQMQYRLIVTDKLTGCDVEKTIFVRFINQCSDEAFYIPNIFSPNGDGSNDYFQILAERPEEFDEIRLFDRWGNHIYVSTDVLGTWDGSFQGKPISTGVYLYMINYTCSDTGEQFSFFGDVTVVR